MFVCFICCQQHMITPGHGTRQFSPRIRCKDKGFLQKTGRECRETLLDNCSYDLCTLGYVDAPVGVAHGFCDANLHLRHFADCVLKQTQAKQTTTNKRELAQTQEATKTKKQTQHVWKYSRGPLWSPLEFVAINFRVCIRPSISQYSLISFFRSHFGFLVVRNCYAPFVAALRPGLVSALLGSCDFSP